MLNTIVSGNGKFCVIKTPSKNKNMISSSHVKLLFEKRSIRVLVDRRGVSLPLNPITNINLHTPQIFKMVHI